VKKNKQTPVVPGQRRIRQLGKIFIAACLISIAGCGILTDKDQIEVQEPALEKLTSDRYPNFSDSMHFSGFLTALDQSLLYYNRLPKSRMIEFGPDQYTVGHMVESLEILQAFLEGDPPASDVNRFVRERFHIHCIRFPKILWRSIWQNFPTGIRGTTGSGDG